MRVEYDNPLARLMGILLVSDARDDLPGREGQGGMGIWLAWRLPQITLPRCSTLYGTGGTAAGSQSALSLAHELHMLPDGVPTPEVTRAGMSYRIL